MYNVLRSKKQEEGYISAAKPLIGKIKLLCILKLLKLEKTNCIHFWNFMLYSCAIDILSTQSFHSVQWFDSEQQNGKILLAAKVSV